MLGLEVCQNEEGAVAVVLLLEGMNDGAEVAGRTVMAQLAECGVVGVVKIKNQWRSEGEGKLGYFLCFYAPLS